jgi:Methyltransferase FkbM domain
VTKAELVRQLWPRDLPGLARYGGTGDGGYVLPSADFARTDALLTCGLGFEWRFEREFAATHPHAPIHVYDPTVGSRRFITAGFWALLGALYSRREWVKFRACCDYFVFFAKRARHMRETIGLGAGRTDIHTAAYRLSAYRDLLLKIDIEGKEYEILDQIVELADRIRMIVIELHDTAERTDEIATFVSRITATHLVAHLHGNNYPPPVADGVLPSSIEVVLVRGRATDHPAYAGALPREGLDTPNNPKRPDIMITLT